jgi:adenine phosphoribosyltransferase
MNTQDLASHIAAVKDFPKPGILFRDITPLLGDPKAFAGAIDLMAAGVAPGSVDAIAGIESRGFIFAAALALKLGLPFVPVRKPGKLPRKTRRESYALEYGTDSIEIHEDAVKPGARVLLVDDLLATGGTMEAALKLFLAIGAKPVEALFLIELACFPGRQRLESTCPVRSLLQY